MHFKKLILAATLATLNFGALGQAFAVMSPQVMGNCGQYMEARKGDDAESKIKAYWAVVWVWGYLSRYNMESPRSPVAIPSEAGTMYLFMEKYCRDQPLAQLTNISTQLIIDLGGNPATKTLNKK
jgi:hypothetical protein